MPLKIDTAGLHPSTESCLKALEWLDARAEFANILDMGCGNGILSLAAASIWDANVLAVDISEKAIEDAKRAIAAYGLEERVTALRSDGFAEAEIRVRAPYDLIICNMLADFQLANAKNIQSCVKKGGYCLLSGILTWR